MHNEQAHIDYNQIARFLTNELSPEEKAAFELWMSEREENQAAVEACSKVLNLKFRETEIPEFDSKAAWEKVARRTDLFDNVVEMKPKKQPAEQPTAVPWMRIAAGVVIVLAAGLYFFMKPTPPTRIVAGAGQLETVLPDSSRVVLKPHASIAYTAGFGQEHRRLELDGAAYFDVTRNESLTFTVDTEIGRIEVLGTAFQITESVDSVNVMVERGKVRLTALADTRIQATLERNEQATLSGSSIEERVVNPNKLYWASKRIVYRQASLVDVLVEFEQLFDKNIQYDSLTLRDCRISAVFKDESFESMMDHLAVSLNFTVSYSGDVVHIVSDGCQTN